MKITICIGSSCHIKGSRAVAERLKQLLAAHALEDKIELGGAFCMGRCKESVCVAIDEETFSVSPETAEAFFRNEILPRL